jgi:hypothetical protein
VDVVGRATHRQGIERLLPGLLVEERIPGEGVRIEQVREVANRFGEVHEPIVEGPFRHIAIVCAEGEVG